MTPPSFGPCFSACQPCSTFPRPVSTLVLLVDKPDPTFRASLSRHPLRVTLNRRRVNRPGRARRLHHVLFRPAMTDLTVVRTRLSRLRKVLSLNARLHLNRFSLTLSPMRRTTFTIVLMTTKPYNGQPSGIPFDVLQSLNHANMSDIAQGVNFNTIRRLISLNSVHRINNYPCRTIRRPQHNISAGINFRPRIPLVTFLNLVRFEVALTLAVLSQEQHNSRNDISSDTFFRRRSPTNRVLIGHFGRRPHRLIHFRRTTGSRRNNNVQYQLTTRISTRGAASNLTIMSNVFNAFVKRARALLRSVRARRTQRPGHETPTLTYNITVGQDRLHLRLYPKRRLFGIDRRAVSTDLLFLTNMFRFKRNLLRTHGGTRKGSN